MAVSDIFEHDLDLTLPEISDAELMAWLDGQLSKGVKLIEESRKRFEGVQYGGAPRETFDMAKFTSVKRAVALHKAAKTRLIGVIGSKPADPDDDMDEKFFNIIAGFRRDYDLTKGMVQ